jgi:hypothetical protein
MLPYGRLCHHMLAYSFICQHIFKYDTILTCTSIWQHKPVSILEHVTALRAYESISAEMQIAMHVDMVVACVMAECQEHDI